MIGCSEACFPVTPSEDMLLTEEDVDILDGYNLSLPMGYEVDRQRSDHNLFQHITAAEEHLIFSYALTTIEGKNSIPSPIFDDIKRTFPAMELKIHGITEGEVAEEILLSKERAFQKLLITLQEETEGQKMSPLLESVFRVLMEDDVYGEKLKAALRFYHRPNQPKGLTAYEERRSQGLYNTSITQLEQYQKCPFRHFVTYTLRPKQQKEYRMMSVDSGNFMHLLLERFFKHHPHEEILHMDEKTLAEHIETITKTIIEEEYEGLFISSARSMYLTRKLKKEAMAAMIALIEQLRLGDFKPYGFEVHFGDKGLFAPMILETKNGERIALSGKIDRLDILNIDDKTYLKTVDYKAFNKKLDLKDVIEGLSLQLFAYMAVLTENTKHFEGTPHAAGVFYFVLDVPFIDLKRGEEESAKEKIKEALRMKGITIKELEILQKLDETLLQDPKSKVVEVSLNKDGSFSKSKNLLTEREFRGLLHFTKDMLSDIGSRMVQGTIEIKPIKEDVRSACDYCDYHSICQIDFQHKDTFYRRPSSPDVEEKIKEIVAKYIGEESLDAEVE